MARLVRKPMPPDHLAVWGDIWQRARTLHAARPMAEDDPVREPFELVAAALVLQRRALDAFLQADQLHSLIRQNLVGPARVFAIAPEELVTCGDRDQVFGQMNLASASLRLPVALLETFDAHPESRQVFDADGLLNPNAMDWNRGECAGNFDVVSQRGCCRTYDLRLRPAEAVTAVLVQRDEYGHGEVGKPVPNLRPPTGEARGREAWLLNRQAVLNLMPRCLMIEAQQVMMDCILTGLEAAPR